MSLVGPRPLIADEYEIHAMRMRFGVYSVRPGVNGLAQIHGRDLVSPSDKVRWDVRYLQDFGFWLDVKILLATVPKIFGGEGVAEGYKQKEQEKMKHVLMITNDTNFAWNLRREVLQRFVKEGYKVTLAGRRKMEWEFDREIVVQMYMDELRRTVVM
jgi:hypothetical protein